LQVHGWFHPRRGNEPPSSERTIPIRHDAEVPNVEQRRHATPALALHKSAGYGIASQAADSVIRCVPTLGRTLDVAPRQIAGYLERVDACR
jgi:hypothetical protein